MVNVVRVVSLASVMSVLSVRNECGGCSGCGECCGSSKKFNVTSTEVDFFFLNWIFLRDIFDLESGESSLAQVLTLVDLARVASGWLHLCVKISSEQN